MRHKSAGRRFGRTTSHRIAMFRNMVTSFLEHEKITTTDAKAKELRSIAEKMITLGKRGEGDLHAIRQAASYIRDKKVVTKLFTTIAPRYAERPGGYTRIIKLGIRPGDNAPVSILELVEAEMQPKKAAAKPAPKAKKAAAPAPAVEAAPVAEAPVAEAPAAEAAEETTEA
ncbi:50S ribosomal protein L17 [Geomonas sp.]|uniref:50S ribosomal protein L17 n=1 Tax=Geomonas sp. TaxID=2651584 RepID=UPI002B4A9B95|nr:50S ribosomal protein L17 [Geomonas sp.]HJV36559.1 50S ribosomal protein L17 [Geomonas sp.]